MAGALARIGGSGLYPPRQQLSDELAKERRLRLTDGQAWSDLFGRESYSGKAVTLDTAMNLATVWACVRLISQAVGFMPLGLYRKLADDGRESLWDTDLAQVLGESPNADQTASEFWEGMTAWLVINGNAYAEKIETGRFLSGLEPLAKYKPRPVRLDGGSRLVYRLTDRGKTEDLPREKVLHLKGFGLGGDEGLSAIRYGVQTFGAAIAADETAGKMFGNGLQVAGVLSSDQTLTKPQRDQLGEIMRAYVGSPNAGKMMILEAGLKYEQLTLNPEDAQMLETRRFHVEDVCRWFGVPPMLIGHAGEGQTMWGSGIEQLLIAWLTLGLNPYLQRIEKRIRKQIIPPGDRRRVYAEFNRESLLQADSGAKATFLSNMVQNGIMSRDEARAKLNLGARGGAANELTAQTALAPLEALGQTQEPTP